ncbi:MAG: DUF2232 domain-containing protein [Spirochaetales bacterium]|nr:DUF2232 domain-containing protein [Spirochaetales bacterium]
MLLYKISPVFFLFILPLMWAYYNRGEKWFVHTGIVALAGILIISMFAITGIPPGLKSRLVLLEVALPAAVYAGVWFILHDFRTTRLIASLYGIASIAFMSVPFLLFMGSNQELSDFFREQLKTILDGMVNGELLSEYGIDSGSIYKFTIEAVFKNFLASLYMMSTLAYYLSKKLFYRFKMGVAVSLKSFTFDDRFVWFFIIGWSGVLVTSYLQYDVAGYIFWNTAMLFTYLFAVRGIAIVEELYDKYSVSKGARLAIAIGCIIGIFTPGINLLIIFGVPVFGVSEIWIHYRERRKGHENHIE